MTAREDITTVIETLDVVSRVLMLSGKDELLHEVRSLLVDLGYVAQMRADAAHFRTVGNGEYADRCEEASSLYISELLLKWKPAAEALLETEAGAA